jgi:type I restriction enzyme S subunit
LIPKSWDWTSADAVCAQITDGEHIQPPYQPVGIPMLSAKHVRDGHVTMQGAPTISPEDFQRAIDRCEPKNGDILIVSVGATTGRSAVVRDCPPFAIVRSVLLLKPLISAEFFLRWLQSSWCFTWMGQASEATAQPHLYIGDTKRMPVPIPPHDEQKRIIAKVNELMAICDQLETQITNAETENSRLLEAVLHEALSPNAQELA